MGRELWKEITGYPKYQCSSHGRIKSLYSNRILKGGDNGLGYKRVFLRNDHGVKCFYIHRLVAILFIDNPCNKPCVNHIDNNPSNNNVDNLEWCTKQENTDWMVKQGRNIRTKEWLQHLRETQRKLRKPVACIDKITGAIWIFDGVNSVADYGFQPSCVSVCCRNIERTHAGKIWGYV